MVEEPRREPFRRQGHPEPVEPGPPGTQEGGGDVEQLGLEVGLGEDPDDAVMEDRPGRQVLRSAPHHPGAGREDLAAIAEETRLGREARGRHPGRLDPAFHEEADGALPEAAVGPNESATHAGVLPRQDDRPCEVPREMEDAGAAGGTAHDRKPERRGPEGGRRIRGLGDPEAERTVREDRDPYGRTPPAQEGLVAFDIGRRGDAPVEQPLHAGASAGVVKPPPRSGKSLPPSHHGMAELANFRLRPGDPAPDFALPGVDGKEHRLHDADPQKLLLVVFWCNHCPYVQAWEGRLVDLGRRFGPRGVAFVLINSNDTDAYPDDRFERMQARAQDKGYPFPYLCDGSQDVARAYGALVTPHAFLFGPDRRLLFQGRIDDNHREPGAVRHRYLEEALEAALAGQPVPTPELPVLGCSVKWRA